MKKTIFIFMLIIFFTQYSLLSMIRGVESVNSGILLTFLLVIFLRRGYFENIGWALLGGLLTDYFSNAPFGFNVMNFVILAFIIDVLKQKTALKEMHFSIVALVVFLGVILSDLVAVIFSNILVWVRIGEESANIEFSIKLFLVKIILAIIGFLFYRLILSVEKFFGIGAMEIKIDKL